MAHLLLILGDQLSESLASLQAADRDQDHILMAEVDHEARYVRHHPQKIALIFSAMRHFAQQLKNQGWTVHYVHYAPPETGAPQTLLSVIEAQLQCMDYEALWVTHCGEYRLQSEISHHWTSRLGISVTCFEDDRFVAPLAQFRDWAQERKTLRMEYFYRLMRRQTGLLMTDDGQPEGGQWNWDADNRRAWKGKTRSQYPLPEPLVFQRDEIDQAVLDLVASQFDHPGQLQPFQWATTRADALRALDHFMAYRLPHFGDFQDAMASGEPQLFHSLLSPYLNCGLLTPMEVCEAAESAYREGRVPLNAAEGFIRQIIGWREYVRGLYWLMAPDYSELNHFNAQAPLPDYFWHGRTSMRCLQAALTQTLETAYAHHIQRLMVIGNFALLSGLSPQAVCDWYLAVYIDAYEWVELPNTLGMALHADGGVLGSKPYAASGRYIQKMSDYCRDCQYQVNTATASDSCPFNSLYWHFLERHRDQLIDNPRMTMMYRQFDKMAPSKRQALLDRGQTCLDQLATL